MLQEDIITKVLGLSNVCIEDIQESSEIIHIALTTKAKLQICPKCGKPTSRIHDYRLQIVRELPLREKGIELFLKKRRYVCVYCKKRFMEKYGFLPRYAHFTNHVYASILSELKEKRSMKDIAKSHRVSPAVVYRMLNLIAVPKYPALPTVMGIDEFKGNTNGEKYNVIITDPQHKKVINILPNRHKSQLQEYFYGYSLEERKKVRVIVMDMWEDYRSLKWMFPNAEIVADKYHWVRQVNFALDRVRKRVQNTLSDGMRLYFKRHRKVLQKEYGKLDETGKIIVLNIIEKNTDLYNAWQLKEMFYEFKNGKKRQARKLLQRFIMAAESLNIPEFKDCITAMHNWATPIINSFWHRYTNGFTEGCNNTIKVIKRTSYGYRNFYHLQKRILLHLA